MFAILAAAAYGIGFVEQGSGGHTNAWFSPMAMLLAGSFFPVLHVAGADHWIPRP